MNPRSWLPLLLAAPLAAQGTIVSPNQFASADGNTANVFPFLTATPVFARYMQVHSDLGTTARLFKQLAFRLNGNTPAATSASLVIDMELAMAPSVDFDKVSWVYANNATGPAIKVIPRQVLNLGPIAGTATAVEPFSLKLPFTGVYPFSGAGSVLWEAKIWANTPTLSGSPNLDVGSNAAALTLAPTIIGTGCTVTGQSAPMKLTYQQGTAASYYTFSAWIDFGPATAPTVLAAGLANPATTIPGMCGAIYTDLLLVLSMGLSDANGFLGQTMTNGATVNKSGGGAFAFVVPNVWPSTTLFFQAHAIDALATSGVPIANSNGIRATATGAASVVPVRVTRLYSTDGGTAQPNAYYVVAGALAGLVTEFSY